MVPDSLLPLQLILQADHLLLVLHPSTSALKSASQACALSNSTLSAPGGSCILLFHISSQTVELPAAPPQRGVFAVPGCTGRITCAPSFGRVFKTRDVVFEVLHLLLSVLDCLCTASQHSLSFLQIFLRGCDGWFVARRCLFPRASRSVLHAHGAVLQTLDLVLVLVVPNFRFVAAISPSPLL